MQAHPDSAWLESADGTRTIIAPSCSIGRGAGNSIVVPDDKVSRRHAIVNAQGDAEFWLIDLGSSNGTYLNSRRVAQPCRLSDQDRIECGGHQFTFRFPRAVPERGQEVTHEKTIQDIKSLSCWLLVADLESSTQFVQKLPADQAARVTGIWLAECKAIIEQQHGVINKFLGDGFFAYWLERPGVAESVCGALEKLKKLQEKNEPRFRIVVHFGQVFVGGAASLGEESLLGTEVNFVFRMEKVAASLGIFRLASEAAAGLLATNLPFGQIHQCPVPSFEREFIFHEF